MSNTRGQGPRDQHLRHSRMYVATHYPVDHLLWDSQTMVSTVQAALGDLSAERGADFFGETACALSPAGQRIMFTGRQMLRSSPRSAPRKPRR